MPQASWEDDQLIITPKGTQADVFSYVSGIIVGNNASANNIAAILKTVGRKIPVYVSSDVCNANWSGMVRRGEKPLETEYNY